MVTYNTKDNPTDIGVYACRVPFDIAPDNWKLLQDIFLMWQDNKWWNLSSDQKYRGKVLGWIGPLQRSIKE